MHCTAERVKGKRVQIPHDLVTVIRESASGLSLIHIYWFAVLLQDGLSSIVQQGLGCPLLASADLHDGLLDLSLIHI